MKFMGDIAKAFILSFCIIAQVNFAYAQSATTASILPPAKTTFLDQNGKPLTGGTVAFSIPGTTTAKTTWQDAAETIPNANPVTLDSAGRALILGSGSYRQIVKDRNNNVIWDQVTSSPSGGGGTGPTATGDGDLVGTIKPWAGPAAPNQYMFAAGQQISRALFPALFTAMTSAQQATCATGNKTITGLTDTTNFWIGMSVEVPCLASGNSTVTAKTSTSVTLAGTPNSSINTTATFFLWGDGNTTTTFTLPDLRGVVIAGNNNMGGSASANLTTQFFGATNPNSSGALGGSQQTSITLLSANLPPYTPSLNIGGSTALGVPGSTGAAQAQIVSTGGIPVFNAGNYAPITAAAQGGLNTPIVTSNVQPTVTANYIIKVTPDQNSDQASGVTSLGFMTGDIACGANLLCTGNTISINSLLTPCSVGVPIVGTGLSTQPTCDLNNLPLGTAAFINIGTSGGTLGLLNTANTWTGQQTLAVPVIGTVVSAPSTPSGGSGVMWFDSTDLRFHDKNSSGTIGTTAVGHSLVASQFLTGMNANGTFSAAQPAITDISGLGSSVAAFLATPSSSNLAAAVTGETGTGALVFGTAPALSGPTFSGTVIGTYTLGGTPAITGATLSGTFSGTPTLSGANFISRANLAQVAASSLSGNPTGSSANESAVTLGSTLGFSGATLNCTIGTTAQLGCLKPDGTTITVSGGVITSSGGSATAITPLTTQIASGTNGDILGVTTSGCVSGSPCLSQVVVGASLTQIAGAINVASHILLNTLTASSSATLSDITSLTSTYSIYEIEFVNILPATISTTLEFQVHSGGAFQTTGYLGVNALTGAATAITNATTFVQLSQTTGVQNTGAGYSGFLRIHAPSNTSAPKVMYGQGSHINALPIYTLNQFSGAWNGGNGAVDGFQVLFSSGAIASGTIKIYGIQ